MEAKDILQYAPPEDKEGSRSAQHDDHKAGGIAFSLSHDSYDPDPLEHSIQSTTTASSNSSGRNTPDFTASGKYSSIGNSRRDNGSSSTHTDEEEVKGSDMNVIEHCIAYCESTHFQNALNDFKVKHVDIFSDLSESKSPEDEEQSLECTSVFNQYNELLDSLLTEQFITKHGYTAGEFYKQCEDIIDGASDAPTLFSCFFHVTCALCVCAWLPILTFTLHSHSFPSSPHRQICCLI
jgi:hypothetical protein